MNHRIRGRYRFLMRVDFRRKHFLKIQAVTYFLCFFLLCAMNIWIDNMGKIQLMESVVRYGGWHYGLIGASEEEIALIEGNRLLEEFGRATVYGSIYKENNNYLGGIGTLEESTLQLCGMRLINGHLPLNENEIVLDQNTLEDLRVPYAPGEEITLNIKGPEDTAPREFTYILCGILQSYSTYTEAGSYLPVAVVSKEGAAAFSASGQQELFIKIVDGRNAVKVREELTEAVSREFSGMPYGSEGSKWIQNTFVYGEDFRWGDTRGIRLLISVTGYAVVFALAFTCVFRERTRTGILRSLGMRDREILFLVGGEQFIIWLAAMFLGLFLGGMGTRVFLESYMRSRNLQTEIFYPVSFLQTVCIISSLAVLAGTLGGTICAKFRGAYRRFREMDYRVLEKGKPVPLCGDMKKALLKRELQVRKKAYISLFCMEVLMFTAVAFCVTWIYQHYQGYVYNKNSYICDYIIENSTEDYAMWGAGRPVDPNLIHRIQNMEGVAKAETVYWDSHVEILDEEVRSGAYYQAVEQYQLNRESNNIARLITLDVEADLVNKLEAQVDLGEWNQEKLESGEEVIIYLPLQGPVDNRIDRISYSKYLRNQAAYGDWIEKQIGVGDILLIAVNGVEHEVKIGGIIYEFDGTGNMNGLMISAPYDIYCGMGLFLKLAGEEANSRTYIYMEEGHIAALIAEQVENMLNRNNVSWNNIRDKVHPQLQYHKNGLLFGMALLAGVGIFFISVVTFFLNKEMAVAAYKNRLLSDLGADFGGEERPYLYWYLRSIVWGILMTLPLNGLIVLFTTKLFEQSKKVYAALQEPEKTYPLILGIQILLLVGELQLQRRILKKKEKFNKNIYYFAS